LQKLLKKLFWVKKSLLILTILLYNSVDLPLGARRQKKEKEGNSFRNFVFRVRVSGILVVIIRLFVCLIVCCCIKFSFVDLTCNFSFARKKKKKQQQQTQHLKRQSSEEEVVIVSD
jgi:hypothetical protein